MSVVGAAASIDIQFQQEIFNFITFDTCAKFFVLSIFRKLGGLIKFSDVKYQFKTICNGFFDQSEYLFQLKVSQDRLFNFCCRPPLLS